MSEFVNAVVDYLCAQRLRVIVIFSLLLIAFFISIAAVLYFDSNTAAYAISVLNLAGIVPLLLVFGYVLYLCQKRM